MARDVKVAILGDAKDFKQAVDQAKREADGLHGAFSKLSSGLVTLGKAAAVGVAALTTSAVGLGVAAAKSFASFEQQLNTLGAVTNATGAQLKQASDKAVALGADLSLPATSAKDAADAMTELAKAGFTVEQAMAAAKGVLQLSAAAQIDNATAATITANAINAFKLQASDAGRVADLLAAAANASSAEILDVADAFTQAASVFATNKIPIEDLTTGIGLLANAGIKGEDAGTTLKTMMLRLLAPTKKATGVMDDLGVSIYDAQGNFVGMRSTIDQFSKALKGMTQEQQAAALSTIFGVRAIRGASVILGEGTDQWDAMAGAVTKGGDAAKLANAKMKGLAGAIEALKSTGETMLLKVGLAIGPTLTKWAFALGQTLPPAFDKATAAASDFVTGFKAIDGSVLANSGVAGFFEHLGATARDVFDAIKAKIDEWGPGFVSAAQGTFDAVKGIVESWGPTLVAAFQAVVDFVSTKVVPAFQSIVDWFDDHKSALEGLKIFVGVALAGAFAAEAAAATAAAAASAAAWIAILGPFALLGLLAAAIIELKGGWHEYTNQVIDSTKVLAEYWLPKLQAVVDFFKNTVIPQLKGFADYIHDYVIPSIQEAWATFEMWYDRLDSVAGKIKRVLDNIQSWFLDIPDYVHQVVDTVLGPLDELAGALDKVGGFFSNPFGSIGHGLAGFFRAEGGPVLAGQPYVVGEKGPEVFVPRSSGTIVPNGGGSTGSVGGQAGGDGGDVYYITIQALSPDPEAIASAVQDAIAISQRRNGRAA